MVGFRSGGSVFYCIEHIGFIFSAITGKIDHRLFNFLRTFVVWQRLEILGDQKTLPTLAQKSLVVMVKWQRIFMKALYAKRLLFDSGR